LSTAYNANQANTSAATFTTNYTPQAAQTQTPPKPKSKFDVLKNIQETKIVPLLNVAFSDPRRISVICFSAQRVAEIERLDFECTIEIIQVSRIAFKPSALFLLLLDIFENYVGNTNALDYGRPRAWSGHFRSGAIINFSCRTNNK